VDAAGDRFIKHGVVGRVHRLHRAEEVEADLHREVD
jgi:hypothetical protein